MIEFSGVAGRWMLAPDRSIGACRRCGCSMLDRRGGYGDARVRTAWRSPGGFGISSPAAQASRRRVHQDNFPAMSSADSFAPPPSLFLPLTEQVIQALAAGEPLEDFLETATRPQLAALMLLLNLKALSLQNTPIEKLERMLDDVMRAALSMEEAGGGFADLVRGRFTADHLAASLSVLETTGIGLLEENEIEDRDFLDQEGQWDFGFGKRHRQKLAPLVREIVLPSGEVMRLSDQQSRIFDEFRGCQDESFHVQAYAGVGKTFLLAKFFENLRRETN